MEHAVSFPPPLPGCTAADGFFASDSGDSILSLLYTIHASTETGVLSDARQSAAVTRLDRSAATGQGSRLLPCQKEIPCSGIRFHPVLMKARFHFAFCLLT
ncbi:hypothetical protein [Faecalibaculum rodentium]|uniref:hypothetical protein n=1 Tax=Faecalibaculum rodentium TaxID=1702221 RepID=UPI0026255D90|nr:hypothetical protein [Faecalibaculum rodentium]